MSTDLSNKYKMTSEQNEARFQEAYDCWNKNKDKASYDKMWFSVQFACGNIAKSIYTKRNIIVPDEDLEEIILDSTMYVMKFINNGVHPYKLSSYCYLRVLRTIQAPKKVWEDKNIVQMPRDNYKDIDMVIGDQNA
jgi:hypothetical protein